MKIRMTIPESLRLRLVSARPAFGSYYLVGGSVRDLHLKSRHKDIDLVCRDAKTAALSIARQNNASFIPMEKKPSEPCYRIVDRDFPDQFLDISEMRGETIEEDLGCRDFTINAMAVGLRDDNEASGQLIDPFHGMTDLQNKIVRMVSPEAFVSDPLRILRAFRFAAVLGFAIDEKTLEAIKDNGPLLKQVSVERITAELQAILLTQKSSVRLRQMDTLGILDMIFPEILPMKGCRQNWYHHKDVWEHSLLVMEEVEHILSDLVRFGEAGNSVAGLLDQERTVLLKLAGLLHDIGKPVTAGVKPGTSRIIFYGHDKAGAELIKQMAGRLKLSSRMKDFLVNIVSGHLRPLALSSQKASPAAHMRWFRKLGDDSVPALILGMADVMSSLGPESTEDYRRHFMDWAEDCIKEYFFSVKPKLETPLLINGHDLIAMGVQPGIGLGSLLHRLRIAQDLGRVTCRHEALALAEAMIAKLTVSACPQGINDIHARCADGREHTPHKAHDQGEEQGTD